MATKAGTEKASCHEGWRALLPIKRGTTSSAPKTIFS